MTCQHNMCDCVDLDATGFCSDHCRRVTAGDLGNMESTAPATGGGRDCGCGHPECTGGTVPLT